MEATVGMAATWRVTCVLALLALGQCSSVARDLTQGQQAFGALEQAPAGAVPAANMTIKALFIILAPCHSAPACTKAELERYVFADVPAHSPLTVQSMFEGCSHGKAILSRRRGSAVVGPIAMPCIYANASSRAAYDTRQCRASDVAGLADYADASLASLGVNGAAYSHHVYVLPPSTACGFIGYSDLGCGPGGCRTWVHGRFWNQVPNYMHELGHSLGLLHAGTGHTEYGDESSAMGTCCRQRCYNAAQNWQLGWEEPAAYLTAASLPPSIWQAFLVPPQARSSAAHLLINPDWAARPVAAAPSATDDGAAAAANASNVTATVVAAAAPQQATPPGLPPSSRRALRHIRSATGSAPAAPDVEAAGGGADREEEGPGVEAAGGADAKPHLTFVSFRPASGLDVNLPPGLQGQVLIHHHLGSRSLAGRTVLKAALAPGQFWADPTPGARFVVVRDAGPGAAVGGRAWVRICRWEVDQWRECALPTAGAEVEAAVIY